MLVALTGATGLVGSYTAAALAKAGHRVRAFVRSTSKREPIAAVVAEWIVGELHDPQALAGLVAGVEAVIHCGVDWDALAQGPIRNFERNVLGSLRLLESARQAQAEQFLFVSSGAVYEEILPDRPLDERHPTWPGDVYGAYKAAVEAHLEAYHKAYGLNTSSWRPTAIYGIAPNLPQSQWFALIKTARDGGKISTDRGGKIVHAADVAEALTLALGDAQVAGQFYNLVDRHMYWQQAAEFAKELTGSSAVIEDRKGPGPKNTFDTRKAVEFFTRHGNTTALRRGLEGVREFVKEMLEEMGGRNGE